MIAPFKPLYRRVKQHIADRIQNGEWRPGDRIPSENELTAELGASRMTVNRAFRELAAEGRIVRTPGVGSFVAAARRRPDVVPFPAIAETLAARGLPHEARTTFSLVFTPKPAFADTFGLSTDTRLLRVHLLHLGAGAPVQFDDRVYNLDLAEQAAGFDFAERDPDDPALWGSASVRLGLSAEAAPRAVTKVLGLAENAPCLVLSRLARQGGAMLAAARIYRPGRLGAPDPLLET